MNIIDQTIVRKSFEFKGQRIIFNQDDKTAALILEDSENTERVIAEVDSKDINELCKLAKVIGEMLPTAKETRKPRKPRLNVAKIQL